MSSGTQETLERLERLLRAAKTALKEADTCIRTVTEDSPLSPHAPAAVGFLMCATSHIDAALAPLAATGFLSTFVPPPAAAPPPTQAC